MIECPDCRGTGKIFGWGCGPTGLRPTSIPCPRCEGNGEVPKKMLTWIAHGKKLKESRMNPYRSMKEEAQRRGYSLLEWADMELIGVTRGKP